MRTVILVFIFLIPFLFIKGSPQSPDFIIIEKDTFALYFLPLNGLTKEKQELLQDNLSRYYEEYYPTTNLWRGFQAIWQIHDNKLYLISIIGVPDSDKILKKTFPDKYKDGKVYADWFSGNLSIPKGDVLRWDGVFSRTYLKEDIYEFMNGNLIKKKNIDNYIGLPNSIPRLMDNPFDGASLNHITDTVFACIKELDWVILSELNGWGCDDSYDIIIDENGKIGDIEVDRLPTFLDTQEEIDEYMKHCEECIEIFKNQLKNLQFDIIKWNGFPYQERIRLELDYFKKDGLENRTY